MSKYLQMLLPLNKICMGIVLLILNAAYVQGWEWLEPHVEITSSGDFNLKQKPFQYKPGSTVYYIDYESGNDNNTGTTQGAAWKHHPWDPNAQGTARNASGANTYVFKKGVTYRGALVADESGTPQTPIQLTSNPDWGTGEAQFYGSERVTNGWQRGSHADMPTGGNVWYVDLQYTPRHVWVVEGQQISRLELARTPNWKISNPRDVMSEWWQWPQTGLDADNNVIGRDTVHLTMPAGYYEGAIVRAEWGPVMGMPSPVPVSSFNADNKILTFNNPGYGLSAGQTRPYSGHRYFLEDKPHYLDSEGEFWFDKTGNGGRLYVRLSSGKNPNQMAIEVARHSNLIILDDQGNIAISGIAFRFTNVYWDLGATMAAGEDNIKCAVIRKKRGSGTNITIFNCRFEHVNSSARIEGYFGNGSDSVLFTDNVIQHTDFAGVEINDRKTVRVLRNYFNDIFYRSWRGAYGFGVQLFRNSYCEVAGNILSRAYGAGIIVQGPGNTPLVRTLIHHNKVTQSLLSACDWGNIESNGGGPNYIYNNISGDPLGYQHRNNNHESWGHAYYLDGTAAKNYLFNNVAWGAANKHSQDTIVNMNAFMQIYGFENTFFNNTAFKFSRGSHRQASDPQRNLYIGNLYMDMSEWVFSHAPHDKYADPNKEHAGPVDTFFNYQTAAYAKNVMYILPQNIAVFDSKGNYYTTLSAFKNALASYNVLSADVGNEVTTSPVVNADAHDFRLKPDSPAINKGAKVFVPWRLYETIGEYNFHRNNANPSHLIDNHWFMARYYNDRKTHKYMPRFPLTGVNITASNYVNGALEDWTKSALLLNGENQYAYISNAELIRNVDYPSGIVPGSRKVTADMKTNNFLLEAYLMVSAGHAGGLIVCKASSEGYALEIDGNGKACLRLRNGDTDVAKRSSTVPINDGKWHHVVAEVDRSTNQGITIYIDGKLSNGPFEGTMPNGSLSNNGDLLVGGGPGQTYLSGALDFLRISRGTLADAKTTIEELHAWQFTDGPQFKDLMGNPVKDNVRDAGAFEGESTYVPVAVREKPVTISQDIVNMVTTLKTAAETGIRNGTNDIHSANNTAAKAATVVSYTDSVELLLSRNSPTISDTLFIPVSGTYLFTTGLNNRGTFALHRVTGNGLTTVASSNANTMQVELTAQQKYVYTFTTTDVAIEAGHTIKWQLQY